MNFENIFILPNVIGDRTRRRFRGIFIKIIKVISARSSLLSMLARFESRLGRGRYLVSSSSGGSRLLKVPPTLDEGLT